MSLSRRTFGKTQTHDVGGGNPDATAVWLPVFGQVLRSSADGGNTTVSADQIAVSSGVGNRGPAVTHPKAMHEVSTE
ncbi:MAG: hypothetical protein HQ453_08650 [Actinobacteria bacterium]|nr:hypothetical protein [Actinomycetota bacterium]